MSNLKWIIAVTVQHAERLEAISCHVWFEPWFDQKFGFSVSRSPVKFSLPVFATRFAFRSRSNDPLRYDE